MVRGMGYGLAVLAGLALLGVATPVYAQDQVQSFFQMFFWSDDLLGLMIIWFLLLLSVVSFGLSGMLFLKNKRGVLVPEDTHVQLEEMLGQKRYREAIDMANNDPSYLARLVSSALNEASNGYGAMERAIDETADQEATRILRPFEFLNILGQVSPMLGLFGTVYGMIVAFQKLVETGGRPDPAELAAGISTALVTTFWGLVVAMPALTFYALLRNYVDAACTDGMLLAEELIAPFKPGAKSGGDKGSGGDKAKRQRATPKPTAE